MPSISPDLLIERGNQNTEPIVLYHYSFFAFASLALNTVNTVAGLSLIILLYFADKCTVRPFICLYGLCLLILAKGFKLPFHDIREHWYLDTRNHAITQLKQHAIINLWLSFALFCMSFLVSPIEECIMDQGNPVATFIFASLVVHLTVVGFFTHLLNTF